MTTQDRTLAAAAAAESKARDLGHSIGPWRLDHNDTQAHARCTTCGSALGVLTLEQSTIGMASWAFCEA